MNIKKLKQKTLPQLLEMIKDKYCHKIAAKHGIWYYNKSTLIEIIVSESNNISGD